MVGGVDPWHRLGVAAVSLREVRTGDHDALFDQMRDPRWVQMAAFTAKDPDDWPAYLAHMAKVRADPTITNRVIVVEDGEVVHTAC